MITILLASYNGEKYIAEQLDSLLAQTMQDIIVFIQDDCSTDGTYEVACSYAEKYPAKIFVSRNESNTGNAKYNFMDMMIKHKDDYVMLCDQDDVWLPDKIEITYNKVIEMEAEYDKELPLLVHTDLRVVDENLQLISPSFMKAMNANFNRTQLKDQLIQNTLTGCTCMYNGTLAKLITAMPTYIVMHDWWLMLVASAFGKIGHIDDQTILYRQHGNNEIGAKDVRTLRYKIDRVLNKIEVITAINQTYPQANGLLELYSNILKPEQIRLLEEYCSIPKLSKLKRWLTISKLGTFKNGLARNVAYLLFI